MDEGSFENISLTFSFHNETNISTSPLDLSYFYQHIGFGLTSVVTNGLIIFILIRNPSLFIKSPFIFTLAIGDAIEGVALAISGFVRVVRSLNGTLNLMVHPTYCLQTFVILFLMGIQLPAGMFVLIGIERFAAVYYFRWYYHCWSNKLAWCCTSLALVFCSVSVLIAWLIGYSIPDTVKISVQCGIMDSVDNGYLVYNYLFAVFGGILATVTSLSALVIFTRRKKVLLLTANSINLRQHVKRQLQLTKVLLCATIADCVLTVIPCLILALVTGMKVSLPGSAGGWSLRLISCRSALNICVYIFTNREFCQATLKAFGLRWLVHHQQVAPVPDLSMSQIPKRDTADNNV